MLASDRQRSALRDDLAALIHQADTLSRRLRALATMLPPERDLREMATDMQTDPATDRLLAAEQLLLTPVAA